MALSRRQIPPTLHFKTLNPLIDTSKTKLEVVDRLTEWKTTDGPRRAGVTSLGIGGTNAHVILEEPPAPEPSQPGRPVRLLTLTAKSAVALEETTHSLAGHLRRFPGDSLGRHGLHASCRPKRIRPPPHVHRPRSCGGPPVRRPASFPGRRDGQDFRSAPGRVPFFRPRFASTAGWAPSSIKRNRCSGNGSIPAPSWPGPTSALTSAKFFIRPSRRRRSRGKDEAHLERPAHSLCGRIRPGPALDFMGRASRQTHRAQPRRISRRLSQRRLHAERCDVAGLLARKPDAKSQGGGDARRLPHRSRNGPADRRRSFPGGGERSGPVCHFRPGRLDYRPPGETHPGRDCRAAPAHLPRLPFPHARSRAGHLCGPGAPETIARTRKSP